MEELGSSNSCFLDHCYLMHHDQVCNCHQGSHENVDKMENNEGADSSLGSGGTTCLAQSPQSSGTYENCNGFGTVPRCISPDTHTS
ncbi:unnamed protein product, partial [Staurois parvus]